MSRETGSKAALNPVWQVEVDRATTAEWSSMLDLFDDANLYQTWSYGAVRWGRKNLSHLAVAKESKSGSSIHKSLGASLDSHETFIG